MKWKARPQSFQHVHSMLRGKSEKGLSASLLIYT